MRSLLGMLAVAAMLAGPALAYLRIVPGLAGFVAFALGGLVATVVGVASLIQGLRGRGVTTGGALGLAGGVVFLVAASRGAGHPRINDFTTDLADPPAFAVAQTLAGNEGRDMAYPPEFAAVEVECCADLHPAALATPPPAAYARALAVASAMPSWRVTRADGEAYVIEAVVTSRLFGFEDDVVIRVRPQGADSSRVDVRSKSRDGKGDLGANAARIRQYVEAVEAAR